MTPLMFTYIKHIYKAIYIGQKKKNVPEPHIHGLRQVAICHFS